MTAFFKRYYFYIRALIWIFILFFSISCATNGNRTRPKIYRSLNEIQTLIDKEDLNGARSLLDNLLKTEDLNPIELANIYSFSGSVHFKQGNDKAALADYVSASNIKNIPLNYTLGYMETAAKFYSSLGDKQNSHLITLERFQLLPTPSAKEYAILGNSYYGIQDYNSAVKFIETAISMLDNEQTRHSWLLTLRDSYCYLDQWEKTESVVSQLSRLYPSEIYTRQLNIIIQHQSSKSCVALGITYDSEHYAINPRVARFTTRKLAPGRTGYVTVQFDLTETGQVENPVVLESNPSGVFDEQCIEAIKNTYYSPRFVNKKPVAISNMRHTYTFRGPPNR